MLLHVVDTTHPQATAQIESVEDTLAELELDHMPVVIALNKIDQLPNGADPKAGLSLNHLAVPVSAVTGQGLTELILVLEAEMERYLRPLHVLLPYNRGDLLAMLYGRGRVEHEEHTETGINIQARLPERLHAYFQPYLLTASKR